MTLEIDRASRTASRIKLAMIAAIMFAVEVAAATLINAVEFSSAHDASVIHFTTSGGGRPGAAGCTQANMLVAEGI